MIWVQATTDVVSLFSHTVTEYGAPDSRPMYDSISTHLLFQNLTLFQLVSVHCSNVHVSNLRNVCEYNGRIRLVKFRHIRSYRLDVSNHFVFSSGTGNEAM